MSAETVFWSFVLFLNVKKGENIQISVFFRKKKSRKISFLEFIFRKSDEKHPIWKPVIKMIAQKENRIFFSLYS